MARTIFYILILIALAYGAFALFLYFMQPKFLYRPLREVIYTPEDLGLDFENITFRTTDNIKLTGWYIPAPDSEYTVLFCHGNGGNIMHRLDSLNIFYNLGLSCFIFDYQGYGQSQGKLTEQGTYADALAAYQWLTKTKKTWPENIILFGRSLGGSIAAQLATKVQAKSLVIESSFTSYIDMGKKFYPYMPVKYFARFSYKTVEYVSNVKCPVIVIHSTDDDIVPFEFGREIYETANEPKEFVEISGNHNDGFLVSGETYKKAWMDWLKFLQKYESQAG